MCVCVCVCVCVCMCVSVNPLEIEALEVVGINKVSGAESGG